ncbi:hypothetical protein EX895_002214 [Sporisorium graminicola]|uniref:Uncharacterized protein n=1 Tax=Sporisorium graminicola TaxID=280036 RepID=A0A4U7KWH1_9BASI|nr:hypothetical protein EX895_002214 [Sporisorium graminicola]TKY88973.1 hypothetical protein EX895_002214 [Sporisorium graminicola]
MVAPLDTARSSSSSSHPSTAFHVAGSTGTSTRNRINASLGKQHFVLNTDPFSPTASKALFDAVPRNAEFESLRPILARLPLELEDDQDQDGTDNDDDDDDRDTLDYTSKRGVLYTRSRLPFLDSTSYHLWKALHHFRPLTADYASGYLDIAQPPPHPLPPTTATTTTALTTCPAFSSASTRALAQLRTSFNWSALPTLPACAEPRSWYGVLFLSVRQPGSESTSFYEADRLAHEEATRSGGLIMYWYGSPNPSTGANLATCIWTSRTAAIAASQLPLHHKAARYAAPSYQRYDLIRYKLVKYPHDARLRIEAWTPQDDKAERSDEQ